MAKLVAAIEYDDEDGNRRNLLVIGELGPGEDGSVKILGCLSESGGAADLPRSQIRAAKDSLIEEESRMDLAIAETHQRGLEEGFAKAVAHYRARGLLVEVSEGAAT